MVRKREDGRWEGRIVVGHKDNGDSIFRYVYADTQKELTARLRKCIIAYQGVDLTEQSRLTLSEWLDQWLVSKEGMVRPGTLNGYRGYIENHIRPCLGEKRISQFKAVDIAPWDPESSGTGAAHPEGSSGGGDAAKVQLSEKECTDRGTDRQVYGGHSRGCPVA